MPSTVKEKVSDPALPKYKIIDSPERLASAVDVMRQQRWIACDLEADSMYHFRERVCLVQLAAAGQTFILDPLQVRDLSPLKPIFKNRRIRKIFHGADYDIRSLYRDFSIEVVNLFDTQMGSRFLGEHETGLDSVLLKRFNVRVDKKYQKKDWSRRPLPSEMIAYAAQDVHYLVPLAEGIETDLRRLGRYAWVEEECEILSHVRSAGDNGEPLFLRFKGAGRLRPRDLAVLEALLHYRKEIAEKKDRPLFKVINNNVLLELAKARPITLRKLGEMETLSDKQVRMHGSELINVINQAMKIPEGDLPVYPRKRRPAVSPKIPRRINALKTWRDKRAAELDLDPSILFNKALLTAIATRNPIRKTDLESITDMRGWQREEFGRNILAVLKTTG